MKNILIAVLLFSTHSFANESCKIITYHQIIKINKTQDDSLIKESNCDVKTLKVFISFIESATGKLQSTYLSHYFKNEFKINVNIEPKSFSVLQIEEMIQDKIKNKSAVVKNVTSLMPQSSITLNKGQNIHIHCKNCNSAGNKNISMEFKGKKYWLNTLIHLKRKSFVLNKNIMSLNEKLDSKNFTSKTILDSGSKMLFEDIENIRFYRLTRYLRKGDIINRSDLAPRILVKYGQKIKVKYKNKNIQLDAIAIANENGKYGDFIQVINPRSKKKVLAKITDYNKAEIEI